MRKLMSLLLVALMIVPFGALAATGISADSETVLYVKEGGTGDGSSADSALASIDAANKIAVTKAGDVTIKIVGTITFDLYTDHYYYEDTHANKITWEGADENAKIIFVTSAKDAKYYIMGGELAIKNINIEISGSKVLVIGTNLYDITIDTGVTVVNPTAASETISIYGALRSILERSPYYNKDTGVHTADPTITIKSGSFKQVVGYMGNASTNLTANKFDGKTVHLDGKVTMNISGADTYIFQLYPVCNSYNPVRDCEITLDGGIIGRFVGATDRKYTAGIVKYGASGVTGTYTLYLTKNFDLAAQSALTGPLLSGEFYGGLCGSTANDDYLGALEDATLGTYILKADAEIFDAVNEETVKINKGTFDSVVKVETPVDPDPETPVDPDPETPVDPDPETPVDPDPETPVDPENPDTGDMAIMAVAVVMAISTAAIVVLRKRA